MRKATKVNHVWSVDFVSDQTEDGRGLKILTVLDEWSSEALAAHVVRKMGHKEVLEVISELVAKGGAPQFIRSDHGSEFVAAGLVKAMKALGVETATVAVAPGSPWQNGRNERLKGGLRYELLEREVFGTLAHAQVMHDKWRRRYNEIRPHGALNFKTPAAFARHERQRGAVYREQTASDSH